MSNYQQSMILDSDNYYVTSTNYILFFIIISLLFIVVKVKVVPYAFVRRGVPVREDTYPEPSACEVGWPVPFLAAFISPVFPLGTNLLLGEQ